MDAFRTRYGYDNVNDALFKINTYTISNVNNRNVLKDALDTFNGADIKLLQKLSSMYKGNNGIEIRDSKKRIKDYLVEIDKEKYKNWNGSQYPTLNQIRNYKEYSEFKSSKFEAYKNPEYEDGQIKNLYFRFVK